jgi:hypothetical protein
MSYEFNDEDIVKVRLMWGLEKISIVLEVDVSEIILTKQDIAHLASMLGLVVFEADSQIRD